MSADEPLPAQPSESATPLGSARQLWRLAPYARPHLRRLGLGGLVIIVATLCGLAMPLVIQRIIDGPVTSRDLSTLPMLAGVLVVLGALESGLQWLRPTFIVRPSTLIEQRLRVDFHDHLQRLPVSFHDRQQSGQLLARASNDVDAIGRFFRFSLLFLLVSALNLVIGLVILIIISPLLGAVFAVINLPLVLISLHMERRYAALSVISQRQEGDLATSVEEAVLGIRVLKAMGRGPLKLRRFLDQAGRLRSTELDKLSVFAKLMFAVIAVPELSMAGVLAVGAPSVAAGHTSIGELVAVITLSGYLLWPILAFGWLLTDAGAAAAATRRYFEVMDVAPTITSPTGPAPPRGPGLVRLTDVRFGFDDREILRGVNLELRPGETVALVGATGSGKTVLTGLLPRLRDVTGGSVTIDGVDVRDLPLPELRSRVALAFEDPVLFSASVRENVRLGCPDASDEEVRTALRTASAESFVDDLPFGLDTRIGEEGLTLSGGQRQRLALARAVIGRPSVLVLDDPLSALDVHTEAEVERALRRVLADVTALVVAHRPSTVALADRVAVLVDGRILAVGTHAGLTRDCPEYAALLSAQPEPVAG